MTKFITNHDVTDALKEVIFFAKQNNIVDLNMVDNIEIKGNDIKVSVVFPKLDDPAVGIVYNSIVKKLKDKLGEDINVDVKPIDEKDKGLGPLSGVKNIIAIIAGKGGVGKSTVAANLAIALSKTGSTAGIFDADIMGPSVPMMFGVEGGQPEVIDRGGKPIMVPLENHGVKILSLGFFVKPGQALMWRGSMINNAFNQLMKDSEWGDLDYLVIDMPPGTGDIQLTLAQSYNIRGAILVTTPQKLATADVRRAAMMYRQDKLSIPLLGIVENMSYFTPDELPDKKFFIFGQGATDELAKELEIPVLGRIPIVEKIVESGDSGTPIVMDENEKVTAEFIQIAKNVKAEIKKL
ncbi:MAG: Mrp/NBP35 family ATP-binding protein [Bacteroidetes bacterium]|nr:Mrp/NBP35 family ATP-binding protein [Bacteroidota bacterium]MBL6943594.1 Mrp/NBP35 family ATP-binding protein [Bacteroidales bacterium]